MTKIQKPSCSSYIGFTTTACDLPGVRKRKLLESITTLDTLGQDATESSEPASTSDVVATQLLGDIVNAGSAGVTVVETTISDTEARLDGILSLYIFADRRQVPQLCSDIMTALIDGKPEDYRHSCLALKG